MCMWNVALGRALHSMDISSSYMHKLGLILRKHHTIKAKDVLQNNWPVIFKNISVIKIKTKELVLEVNKANGRTLTFERVE